MSRRPEFAESIKQSPYEIAREKAIEKVGPQPVDGPFSEQVAYWDLYWDAYYAYTDTNQVAVDDDIDEPWIESSNDYLEGLRGNTGADRRNFFRQPEAREEVFQFSKAIAEYIKDNEVKNLVIADRSSRPLYVGVMEYWRKVFPNDPMPGIFFVNPKGFKDRESHTTQELQATNYFLRDDAVEPIDKARTQKDIMIEFRTAYPRLFQDQDKPVLIFDTCIHSGDTLDSVVKTFKKSGFENVIVGSVNPGDQGSKVKTDFYITTKEPEQGCYPFDRDRMIEKTFEHVYSRPTTDQRKKELGIELREEIREIMKDHLG